MINQNFIIYGTTTFKLHYLLKIFILLTYMFYKEVITFYIFKWVFVRISDLKKVGVYY